MRGSDLQRTISGGILLLVTSCIPFGDDALEELDHDAAPLSPQYEADLAPIFERYCLACHRPEAMATARATPWLDTEPRVERYACRVHARVTEWSMPPGAMDRPTSRERLTLDRWADDVLDGVFDCPDKIEQ